MMSMLPIRTMEAAVITVAIGTTGVMTMPGLTHLLRLKREASFRQTVDSVSIDDWD